MKIVRLYTGTQNNLYMIANKFINGVRDVQHSYSNKKELNICKQYEKVFYLSPST